MYKDIKIGRNLPHEQFLIDLVEGRFPDADSIASNIEKLKLNRCDKCQIGLVHLNDAIAMTAQQFAVLDYLEMILPDSKCATIESYIVMGCFPKSGEYLPETLQEKLIGFLKANNCICILSPVIRRLEYAPVVFEHLKSVSKFIYAGRDGKNLYHYHSFAEQHGIEVISQKIPLYMTLHPLLQKLINYDSNNHTNYLETLKVFLRNNCNIARSSKILYMHRNSLQNRINRIEELLSCTFDDWEIRRQILFSMACQDFAMSQKGDVFAKTAELDPARK
jgi:sugar diacid utilization regulator